MDYKGLNTEEENARLAEAKRWTDILNAASLLVAIVHFFSSHFIFVQSILLITFPILAILLLRKYQGLITIDDFRRGSSPNLLVSLFLPSLSLAFSNKYSILDYGNFWLPFIFVFLLAIVSLLRKVNIWHEFKDHKGMLSWNKMREDPKFLTIVLAIIISLAYSSGFVGSTNAFVNFNRPPVVKEVVIIKKHVTGSGKSRRQRLFVKELGSTNKAKEIDLETSKKVGDTLAINYSLGLYKIPYIFFE